jgi:excisionase family DNA binding protein
MGPTHRGRIRVDRDSLSWSLGLFEHGEIDLSDEPLPRWTTVRQAAEYYQIRTATVRHLIAAGQLKAKQIGKSLRIERESLLHLGEYPPRKYENRL